MDNRSNKRNNGQKNKTNLKLSYDLPFSKSTEQRDAYLGLGLGRSDAV